MTDREAITARLERLKLYYERSKRAQLVRQEELFEDFDSRAVIERCFHIAIECIIDICELIISAESLRRPQSYKEAI